VRVGRLAWCVPSVVAACSTPPANKPVVSADVPWAADAARGQGGSARWAYTPPRPSPVLGRVSLDGGRVLSFGKHGERWLEDPATPGLTAAGELADQDLVALSHAGQGSGFSFVGRGGSVFEASGPLEPFSRVVSPPEPLASVDASGDRMAAVTLRGELVVSRDGGGSFQKAIIDAPFVGDVALLDGANGFALAYPERLYRTEDGGLTFTPFDAPTVGATRLVRDAGGGVAAVGFHSSVFLRPGDKPVVRRAAPQPPSFAFKEDLGPAPDASAVREGRAFFLGDTVVAARPTRGKAGFSLARARLGERFSFVPLERTEECQRLSLAGDEKILVGACSIARRGASVATVRLLRWDDPQKSPAVLPFALEGPLADVRVELGLDGRVLVLGACRTVPGRGCDADTPQLLTSWASARPDAEPAPGDAPSPFVTCSAPALAGRPLAVRFSRSGAAYLLGRRVKTGELALFVSRDEGRSFEPRDLDLAGTTDERRIVPASITGADISTVDDGTVSVALESTSGTRFLLTDHDGRPLTWSSAPAAAPTTRIGIAGRRALVTDGPDVFETTDGGISWQSLGDVPALRCDDKTPACERPVACGTAGCVVGQEVSRIGWGGQRERERPPDADAGRTDGAPRGNPAPLVCRLGKERWIPLPRGVEHAPMARDADRGRPTWGVAAEDLRRGSVTMVHGVPGPTPRIEEVPLLPPVRDPTQVALLTSDNQVEGTVAVRFSVPPTVFAHDQPLREVEIAWENFFEGKLTRATIKDAGTLRASSTFTPRGADLPHKVQTWLLSITATGVFLRLGTALADAGPLFFVDHRGNVERSVYPGLSTRGVDDSMLSITAEAVRVDGVTVPVGLVGKHGVIRRRKETEDAVSVFAPEDSPFAPSSANSFTYLAGAPVYVHYAYMRKTGSFLARLFPFRADGAVLGPMIAGPTQRGVVEKLRPCAAADRAKTARLVAAPEAGTRRAVVVEGPDGTRFAALVSHDMVLYGTREAPCAAALEAIPVRDEEREGEDADRALVFFGDQEHAWFFRPGVNDPSSFEARTMRCHFEPNAMVPPALQRALDSDKVEIRARKSGRR
jgi:hypothetical protein